MTAPLGNYIEPPCKAIVITPTTGSARLMKAMESVQNQAYKTLLHLIVIDGEQYKEDVCKITREFDPGSYKLICLPFNTGREGFNGHRIYAACSFLVNADYVFFLDEDNWYDDDHVSSLIALIEEQGLKWAYSLRKIYDHTGNFIVNDDCESIGKWPAFSGRPHLVDTSCYAIKREVLVKVCHAWYHHLGADRAFFKTISSQFPDFETSSRYTMNYCLHQNRPPFGNFFEQGNKHMSVLFKGKLPWLEEKHWWEIPFKLLKLK